MNDLSNKMAELIRSLDSSREELRELLRIPDSVTLPPLSGLVDMIRTRFAKTEEQKKRLLSRINYELTPIIDVKSQEVLDLRNKVAVIEKERDEALKAHGPEAVAAFWDCKILEKRLADVEDRDREREAYHQFMRDLRGKGYFGSKNILPQIDSLPPHEQCWACALEKEIAEVEIRVEKAGAVAEAARVLAGTCLVMDHIAVNSQLKGMINKILDALTEYDKTLKKGTTT